MKPKPKGPQYRNLTAYRGEVWYERTAEGKRHRFSLRTTSWSEAAKLRETFERGSGITAKRSRVAPADRTLGELTDDFLAGEPGENPSTMATKRRCSSRGGRYICIFTIRVRPKSRFAIP